MAERTISAWGQLLGLPVEPAAPYMPGIERRAWPRSECDVPTTYQLTRVSDDSRQPAQLQNISPGGINVLVDRPLERGMVLQVELPGVAEQSPCNVLACAIHARPRPIGGWLVGCALVNELTDEELQAFGAERLPSHPFDQRRWVRFSCDLQASYRCIRVTERQRLPARVIDVSAGGMGLLVGEPIDGGTLLSLQVEGPGKQAALSMLACVVRITPHPTGQWVLGCNFIRELTDRELEPLRRKTP